MATYNRNRQSIQDIEEELHDIFANHPESRQNDIGEPVIPSGALVDALRTFEDNHDGMQLLDNTEMEQMQNFINLNPDIDVTPNVLIQFLHQKIQQIRASPQHPSSSGDEGVPSHRRSGSRSSSRESSSSSTRSRPPALHLKGPQTPQSSKNPDSPFESTRRQRANPVKGEIPSSWNAKRALPAYRRRSDASETSRALSDTESNETPTRPGSRKRTPSNPSPSNYGGIPRSDSSDWGGTSPYGPPPSGVPLPRPHSRSQSHGPFNLDGAMSHYYDSPPIGRRSSNHSPQGFISSPNAHSPHSEHGNEGNQDDEYDDSFGPRLHALPVPEHMSDPEDEDQTFNHSHLIRERTPAPSTASLEPLERVEALQRNNEDLSRKVMEVERTLQQKLTDHENDLEEMQNKLEETKSELSTTRRDEKELRAKERQHIQTIATLETEIQKLQRNLESARTSYQNLQKQYQEQCAESERYRNTLRRRDEEVKDFRDQVSLHSVEQQKSNQAREQAEAYTVTLEQQLAIAMEAQTRLEEQKQENLLLKETIDRMRFDMDELRNKAENPSTNMQGTSAQGSISKSLGLEFLRMKDQDWLPDDDEVEEDERTAVGEGDDDEEEGEDVIQTIITRKHRKVAGRANRSQTIRLEETKEYCDAYTQHELSEFTTSHRIQTDPEPVKVTASFSIQTEESTATSFAIQTEAEPVPEPRQTAEMEVQTEASRSPSPVDEMTSSTSTLQPPTPKSPLKHELPPSYAQVSGEPEAGPSHLNDELANFDLNNIAETVQHWHKGLTLPVEPVKGGISEDAVEEWQALKEELGIDCSAIDQLMEASFKTGPRSAKEGTSSRRKSNRFYNIYNTYIYPNGGEGGDKADSDGNAKSLTKTVQVLLIAAAGAALGVYFVSPQPTAYHIPGGPTYYDREAWSSFNSLAAVGEGFFGADGNNIWNLIGRVGGNAARIVGGMPT